jgi:hypothetical protein
MNQDQQQYLREQAETNLQTDATGAAVRAAMSKQVENLQNPDFLEAIQDPDVDTPVHDWLSAELGPVLSGAHVLGERPPEYGEVADLLEGNAAERYIAERSPGRFLREDPELLAIAQDVHGVDDPAFRAPIDSARRRVVREAHDVAAQRKTMSIDGAGRDTVGAVQTETKTNRRSDEQRSSERFAQRIFG